MTKMAIKGGTFKINLDSLSRLGTKAGKAFKDYDVMLERRTKAATNIIWRTAHARRPMISKTQMKAEGRSRRVSDPNAQAGVPVRTGALQASITQLVIRMRGGFRGIVETHGIPYAGYIEYGTERMAARPFMRPAVNLNKEVIKRVYGVKVDHNL